jgi:hypothetical protein
MVLRWFVMAVVFSGIFDSFAIVLLGICNGFAKVLLWCCCCLFVVLRWLCYGILTCIGFDLVLARLWCGFVIPHEAVWVWFW